MKNLPTRLAAVVAVALSLSACDQRVETRSVSEEFTITRVQPPKRLYVDVVDNEGRSYHVFVSKRCPNWRRIAVGSKVTLERTTHRWKSGLTETSVQVRSAFDICPR